MTRIAGDRPPRYGVGGPALRPGGLAYPAWVFKKFRIT